jgi:hypothetical protein
LKIYTVSNENKNLEWSKQEYLIEIRDMSTTFRAFARAVRNDCDGARRTNFGVHAGFQHSIFRVNVTDDAQMRIIALCTDVRICAIVVILTMHIVTDVVFDDAIKHLDWKKQ